ncbi:hypothetical protein L2E82_37923 [Cichorium intybus]|uniref:Uncharacterized protein n=1 Tax=Cichorium intybus TaxID=13427 RepID=A0ACB9AF15_CICIN|nr:hypothetical protein L2E82_37923 [Cichorium intybus]
MRINHVQLQQLMQKIEKYTGHFALLHGCTVENEAFVGMKATLFNEIFVENQVMVATGALGRQGTEIPNGEVPNRNYVIACKTGALG